jgi:hypothetical protein
MNRTLDAAINLIDPKFTHVLEFGVHHGKTVRQLRNTLPDHYKLFGFDSFTGLPEDWTGTPEKKGSMSTNGVIPNIPGVTFYKGWFTETIPVYKQNAATIALLHVDCDLYSSTIDVLYGLRDYIAAGTVIVFDEWYYNHKNTPENSLHEQKAFLEWAKEFNISYIEYDIIEDERKIVKIQ